MNTNPMTFQPRFPWVDDERDTRAYIPYDVPNKNDIYIPTFVIMKQYYDEEKERLYGKAWNKDSIWELLVEEDEDWNYSFDYDSPSSQQSEQESDYDYDYDYGVEVSDNENDEVVAQPPSVSNKFWYS
jgi:hypothetical protein